MIDATDSAFTRVAVVALTLLVLSACGTSPQYRSVNQEVLAEIQTTLETAASRDAAAPGMTSQPPPDVLQALVPGLTLSSQALQPVEERFDFIVQEPMDAREFFTLLTEGTQYSIALHPNVMGTVSALDLKNVTIEEALAQVSTLYGFAINRSGNIFQVMPGGMQTRIFKVDYLNVARNGSSNMSIVAGGILSGGGGTGTQGFANQGVGNNINQNLLNNQNLQGQANFAGGGSNTGGASISTTSQSDYWQDLESIITSIINSGSQSQGTGTGLLGSLSLSSASQRSVIVSPQTGMIVVRAYPNELDQVAEFLERSQSALQRQVVLEAKILEVELKEGFQMGIDLSLLGKVNTDNSLSAGFTFLGDSLDSISSPLKLTYGSADFNGVIELLETQGNVQVISSPRIATLNNQKAVFKVGDEQYFLTNANSTSFGAGEQQTTNQNTNLQPFFSGIALDVTPQISENGDIILHIHPLLNSVQEDIKVIGGNEFPLANSTTRESDSVARARNGEVIVISGLMQTRARGSEAGIPGAKDIPVVGNAFGQRQTETVKTELVILLRAIVDEDNNMQEIIQDHTNSFEDLRRQIDPYYR
jgi:MSHA biogenesis protein MshL